MRSALRAPRGSKDDTAYWTTDGTGTVASVELSGGAPRRLSSGVDPSGIVVDEQHVYWTDGVGLVNRALHTGGEPTVLATTEPGAWQMAIDARNIYWIAGDTEGVVMKLAK